MPLVKEFLDRCPIQKRSAQNSQHFVGSPLQLEVMFNDSHHAICSDCRVYLNSDCSLCCTPEGLMAKTDEISSDPSVKIRGRHW